MNARNDFGKLAAVLAAMAVCFAGCKRNEEPAPASGGQSAAPSKPAIVSAEKNSFAEVTSKLDPGGNLYLYLSTEQFLGSLSNGVDSISNIVSSLPNIPGTGRDAIGKIFTVLDSLVKHSGITEVSGVGMSSIAREPGLYYNKFIVHHYPGQNQGFVWSLFGQSPHPLKVLDMLPETTALASSMDFELPLLWTNGVALARSVDNPEVNSALDELPQKFQQATGLDLDAACKSLGGEYGAILTLDQQKTVTLPLGLQSLEIPNPALCLIFKVKSDLIFDRVDQILNENPIIGKLLIKTDEKGLKMRTVPVPLPLPIELHPTIARVDDYLLIASSDSIIREMVAVKSGQKKGFKSTDAFKRLSQGIPESANSFSLVTPALTETLTQIQQTSLAKANFDSGAVNKLNQLFQGRTNGGSFGVNVNGPEGWEGIANGGSQGVQMLVLPAVAGVGIMAAVAIPNFVKARATSQQNVCINNLRMIDAAKQQWALEKHKQQSDTPTMEDLLPYLGHGDNAKAPVCPAGGVYTTGSVGEKPTCSIAGHVLP
ncbi:MAG TPA: hypothetical protein VGO59_14965 [Verrucomicrobiae bacterium]|jgi:competence protein ComGC